MDTILAGIESRFKMGSPGPYNRKASMLIAFLAYFIVFGAIGALIGQKKGRPFAGLVWAMVLGPIGWLLVALLPAAKSGKATECPHCGGILPLSQSQCNHCGNRVTWLGKRAVKPSRAAA